MIKPLDFVRAKGTVVRCWNEKQEPIIETVCTNNIGIVTEVCLPTENWNVYRVSIDWLDNKPENRIGLFNAWWFEKDLIVINSLPNLLGKAMAHPFGSNKHGVDTLYPIKIEI